MQSTINLFHHLYETLPPLFPAATKEKIAQALERLEQDQMAALDEVEETMIAFGYEVWAWNQAYREFLAVAESAMGEHFLLPKFTPELCRRYEDYRQYGGTLHELRSGRPANFFSGEERVDLGAAFVEAKLELENYVNNEIMSVHQEKYLKRVAEFANVLEEITVNFGRLNELAAAEQDHPALADQIRSRVRAFEYGLCFLGPETDLEAVCQSVDFFTGRKDELNRLRGIHEERTIDFYGS